MTSKLENKDLRDKTRFKDMTRWFSPIVLIKCGIQAVVTSMFSQYADARLTTALLDKASDDDLIKRANIKDEIRKDEDGAIWVDYVADLGDGFDSTYAVANLLARKSLKLSNYEPALPRGSVLIMGGDEVYPFPNRDEYRHRMQDVYRYAFPDSKAEAADHPKLFVIPGNHDWYDGLKLFLGLFCCSKGTTLGSWRINQHRSYFSLRIAENWWIWGLDSNVDDQDIDDPQAKYFALCADNMPTEGANVIICAPAPRWNEADEQEGREQFARVLDYVATKILKEKRPKARIRAVLSGDSHHYSRYRASTTETQFITAGGGGAFLHPTHHLRDEIVLNWRGATTKLSLRTEPGLEFKAAEREACYPLKEASRKLVLGNIMFPITNFTFCLVIGALYWVIAITTLTTRAYNLNGWMATNPFFLVSMLVLFGILRQYSDSKKTKLKNTRAVIHLLGHVGVLLGLMAQLPKLNALFLNDYFSFLFLIAEMVVIGGVLGGLVWGVYLMACSYMFGTHHNDAFSAMGRADYKNFLRLKIRGDALTIYPIGLDRVPGRKKWEVNPDAVEGNQNEPVIRPVSGESLAPHLIEGPIIAGNL